MAGEDPEIVRALQPLAAVALPDAAALERAFGTFAGAVAEVRRLEATDAERLDALARLLEEAVSFHRAHGADRTCPVCGTEGVLDADWAARSESEIQGLRLQSGQLRHARADLATARRALGALFGAGLPAALRAAGDELDVADAHDAWDGWAAMLADDDRRAPARRARGRRVAPAVRAGAA